MSTENVLAAPASFRFTLVLEWETQQLAGQSLARANLQQLRTQLGQLRDPAYLATLKPEDAEWLSRLEGPVELLMTFDGNETPEDALRAFIADELPEDPFYTFSWLNAPGVKYYELKNLAAQRAQHELLVFLDTDVVPEPGWLKSLLCAHNTGEERLVTGVTHVDPVTVADKAFAVAWICPIRHEDGPPFPHYALPANNFALPRTLFLRHPFPHEPWRSRKACVNLAKTLKAAGVPMYRAPEARGTHPIPVSLGHGISRGMNLGRDILCELPPTRSHLVFWGQALYHTARQIGWSWRNVLRDGHKVRMTPLEIPVAMGVLGAFYAWFGVGMVWARYAPDSFERNFPI